ncbi:histidinol phosphate aminotransferase apoenzyme [Nitratireductor indicus C115]|uniref:Histidinol phosphate aminotransferase apoenzyme n=1 Tax=Nitratireductor indicus C115 TaxID=1231190 RepID=K2NQ44_9HYPH|nr:histidinol-phosphate transaminase [Nitratireductor indicus]EKF39984.1 histidinol phosphate aminotransferase apoenzyme [Nitratireductor indicus C115]SFQ81628.1 histidinol-phosphate aminotransferase/threonine-phosphate decarboxylase [Nitratireductor indicus]
MTLNAQNAEMASLRLYEAETSIEVIARQHGLNPVDVIDFSLNVNPLGSPPAAVVAAQEAVQSANLYPDLRFGRLRAALAERHGVEEDSLFFGAGLDDVIKLLLQAWTSSGDKVLVHIPTFPRYELEARLRGCRVIAVASDRPEVIGIANLERELAQGDVALSFICTPNNPTGATVDNADIARLAQAYPSTLFVIDEALIYPLEEGAIPLCADHPNLCVLRTFSKYFGLAGLRIGYAIASSELVRIAEVGRPPFNMSEAAVQAAVAALADRQFLPDCKATFQKETRYFRERLAAVSDIGVKGTNANMLLLDLAGRDASKTAETLAAMGIVVADATSFHGLEHHPFLRVSLRSREDNLKLIAALERV